jgi:hypothetical protein
MVKESQDEKKPSRDSFGLTAGNYRAIIISVTTVWLGANAFGMISSVFDLGYEPPAEVNAIFLAVVVGAFTARTRANGGGKDDE